MPYLSFAAICLLFGSNFVLMSRASQAFGPVEVAAGRVVGAIVMLSILWRVLSPQASVPRRKLLSCLAVGLVANAYPYVVQPYLIETARAMNRGAGHSFFGMMVAFTPLLTILASIPLLGVKPTLRQVVGVIGGLGFMGLLMQDGSARGITLPMLLLAFSVPLSYAVTNTYIRRAFNDIPAIALTTTTLLGAAVVLIPLALATPVLVPLHLARPAEPKNWSMAIAAVLALGVTGTGFTMWLFVRLLQTQGPLFAGMVTYVVPLVALSWGAFDSEQITTMQIVGIAGVLSMVALVQFGTKPAQASRSSDDVARTPGKV